MNEKPQISILPTHKNQPKSKVSDYNWLIFGPPGIGKTTLASQFDNPLILACDPGTKHLECYSVPIGKWQDIIDVGSALRNETHNFKTLVIDTVDIFYRLFVNNLMTRRGIEHPTDEPFGKGGDMVKNGLFPVLNSFSSLGMGIVYISQQRFKEVKQENPRIEYQRIMVSLSDAPALTFVGLSDIVGYCNYDKDDPSKRIITFKGSLSLEAKARTNKDVTNIPDSCELNYNIIKSYFKGEQD